jgi:cytochrome P450
MTTEVRIADLAGAREALAHPDLAQALYDAGGVIMDDVLLTLHGDAHRQRRLTEFRVFTRAFFRRYEHETFPRTLAETLAPFLAAGGGDLVDLGYRVTLNLTADFAGIDRPARSADETRRLRRLVAKFSEGATLVHSTRDPEALRAEVRAALDEFEADFLGPSRSRREALLAAHRRGELDEAELPTDLMTVLLRHGDELPLTPEVFRREIAFFLQAGSHSTANSLVHAFHEIHRWRDAEPTRAERLASDPLLLQRAVHESMRLHPASPVAWRRCTAEVELGAAGALAPGTRIVVDMQAANRDPEVFGSQADRFDPERTVPNGVQLWGMSFGYGVHACLGRDLDGGVVPVAGTDPTRHQYGIVTRVLAELLDRGAAPDAERAPEADADTVRANWGAYPFCLAAEERDRTRGTTR